MIAFVHSFLAADYAALKLKMAIVGIFWLFVIVAIIIDLVSGYRKAKLRGEARTSYGLRRTISKFTLYFSCLLLVLMIDALIMFVINSFSEPVPAIPYITIIGSAYLIYVEFRSVMEKADSKDKARYAKGLSDLALLLDNKDDFLKALSELIKKETTNQENSNEDKQTL